MILLGSMLAPLYFIFTLPDSYLASDSTSNKQGKNLFPSHPKLAKESTLDHELARAPLLAVAGY